MSSINEATSVHEFLVAYFKNDSPKAVESIAPLEKEITSLVERVFSENAEKETFSLVVKDTAFPPLRPRHIAKIVGLAIQELYPNYQFILEDGGLFKPRGEHFLVSSCEFTIKRPGV